MGIWLGDEAAKTDIHFASHWRKDLVQNSDGLRRHTWDGWSVTTCRDVTAQTQLWKDVAGPSGWSCQDKVNHSLFGLPVKGTAGPIGNRAGLRVGRFLLSQT